MRLTVYTSRFTVEGSGTFPHDMLRYDWCVPASEHDSAVMGDHDSARRRVELTRLANDKKSEPTRGRWASFGWRVL